MVVLGWTPLSQKPIPRPVAQSFSKKNRKKSQKKKTPNVLTTNEDRNESHPEHTCLFSLLSPFPFSFLEKTLWSKQKKTSIFHFFYSKNRIASQNSRTSRFSRWHEVHQKFTRILKQPLFVFHKTFSLFFSFLFNRRTGRKLTGEKLVFNDKREEFNVEKSRVIWTDFFFFFYHLW